MAAPFLLIAAIVLLLLTFVGGALLFLGLSGRLVSTHPHCRRCKFDLIGITLDASPAAPRPVCPECGRAIAGPADVRHGLRQRARTLIVIGTMVLLAPWLAGGGAIILHGRTNWNAWKPDWWLMAEAQSLQPAAVGPQLVELRTRLEGGTLSASNADELIARALTVQADRTGGWTDEWGDVINAAAVAGRLDQTQLQSHARNAPTILVSSRSRIAQDDPWVVELLLAGGRVGDAPVGRAPLELACQLTSVKVGDATYPTKSGQSRMGIHPGGGFSSTVSHHALTDPVPLPGDYDAITTWSFVVRESGSEQSLAEWTEDRTVPITIEPTGTDLIELVDDATQQPVMQAALSAPQGIYLLPPGNGSPERSQASFHLRCNATPVALAVDFFLRERRDPAHPDRPLREWPAGQHSFMTKGMMTLGAGAEIEGFDDDAVDMVLRPSPAAARKTINVYKIWNREIVIENIPVHRPPPSVPPPASDGK